MGNTKLVYFEGEGDRAVVADEVLRAVHGTYCTVESRAGGYLDPGADGFFTLGALHTDSMCHPADALGALFSVSAIVVVADLDWSDCTVFEYDAGQLAKLVVYSPDVLERSENLRVANRLLEKFVRADVCPWCDAPISLTPEGVPHEPGCEYATYMDLPRGAR